jgi:hypothetical protein
MWLRSLHSVKYCILAAEMKAFLFARGSVTIALNILFSSQVSEFQRIRNELQLKITPRRYNENTLRKVQTEMCFLGVYVVMFGNVLQLSSKQWREN